MQFMNMSRKKPSFPVNSGLRKYLKKYKREVQLPIHYEDMLRWSDSTPLINDRGENTYWESVIFDAGSQQEILNGLRRIYALLKTDGDTDIISHLAVSRIDYCLFGNSNPFRIRIVNQLNDNHDYFYIKKADASRIFGLELEHILSPNRIEYLVDQNTLIEAHIAGIPGDVFIENYMDLPNFFPQLWLKNL